VRLVTATFDRDIDANAAHAALAGLDGVVKLHVHAKQPASDGGRAYAVVVARVVPSVRGAIGPIVARFGGQVVFDLDEALGDDSKPSSR
jgi:hypothetical protein